MSNSLLTIGWKSHDYGIKGILKTITLLNRNWHNAYLTSRNLCRIFTERLWNPRCMRFSPGAAGYHQHRRHHQPPSWNMHAFVLRIHATWGSHCQNGFQHETVVRHGHLHTWGLVQRSGKVFFLGCVTRPLRPEASHATQPRKKASRSLYLVCRSPSFGNSKKVRV